MSSSPGVTAGARGASSVWWVRCSIDLSDDLTTVRGYSWEVRDAGEVVEVLTTTVPPDVSPLDCLTVVLAELQRRYGVQMELQLF